jgi:hypothetical protein
VVEQQAELQMHSVQSVISLVEMMKAHSMCLLKYLKTNLLMQIDFQN